MSIGENYEGNITPILSEISRFSRGSDSLERVYELEKVVWKLFVGNQPTPEQNKLFAKFREMLVQGNRLKANA
jgi:hypothetical protein